MQAARRCRSPWSNGPWTSVGMLELARSAAAGFPPPLRAAGSKTNAVIGDYKSISVTNVGPVVGRELRGEGEFGRDVVPGGDPALHLVPLRAQLRSSAPSRPWPTTCSSRWVHPLPARHRDQHQHHCGACLTIVGYSLNDTIVVFDRIRENLALDEGREACSR